MPADGLEEIIGRAAEAGNSTVALGAYRPRWGACRRVRIGGGSVAVHPIPPHEGLTADQELKAKNDVRTTLVQALAGLAVAGGSGRHLPHLPAQPDRAGPHLTSNRIRQDRTYQLRQAEQVNELYTRAVEQLGHDEAPVRLGALYSLMHLAQANPDRRQTVVDVLCAYLRMPYAPPEIG